jgi:mono/diheme cytochrome c family protein
MRWYVAVTIAAGLVAIAYAVEPGDPVGDVVVRDRSGAQVQLFAYRQKKMVALLVERPDATLSREALDDAGRRLAPLGCVVARLDSDSAGSRALLGRTAAATILIDRDGVVRRILAGRALAGAELAGFAELWLTGKTWFGVYCARCHGDDGESTLCTEKPLAGVGRRMPLERIRESLRIGEVNDREVVIRGEIIRRERLEALLVYVGGL